MSAAETIAALANDNRAILYRTLKGDDQCVAAWNERISALGQIEERGSFYLAEMHSPQATDAFEANEEALRTTPADTLQGVIAKLWAALAHLGPTPADAERYGHHEQALERTAQHAAVRRGDSGEVASFIADWDYGEETLFGAIRDLERLTREAE